MRGEAEGVAGSQPMSTAVHITWHGAQINFGDLTPYLTYAWNGLHLVHDLVKYLLWHGCQKRSNRHCWETTAFSRFFFSRRMRTRPLAPLLRPRRLIRSSRPKEIFQPPQQGFFSVHAQLQLLGNIFQLFTQHPTSPQLTSHLTTLTLWFYCCQCLE